MSNPNPPMVIPSDAELQQITYGILNAFNELRTAVDGDYNKPSISADYKAALETFRETLRTYDAAWRAANNSTTKTDAYDRFVQLGIQLRATRLEFTTAQRDAEQAAQQATLRQPAPTPAASTTPPATSTPTQVSPPPDKPSRTRRLAEKARDTVKYGVGGTPTDTHN